MEKSLVRVNFYGQQIDCIKNEEGVWVSLRRVCENIGLDDYGQAKRIREKAWAVASVMEATGSDGKTYDMLMLHMDSVPMWLATIDAERVAEEIRPKIELYQRECAKALRDYWFKGEAKRDTIATETRAEAMLLNARARMHALALQTIDDIHRLTPLANETISAIKAVATETLLGKSLPALKPKTSEEWYTPTQIAEMLDTTPNRVGLIISELGIRGNIEGICRAVLNKAAHSEKTVTSYQYTPKAVAMIAERLPQPAPEEAL